MVVVVVVFLLMMLMLSCVLETQSCTAHFEGAMPATKKIHKIYTDRDDDETVTHKKQNFKVIYSLTYRLYRFFLYLWKIEAANWRYNNLKHKIMRRHLYCITRMMVA